MDKLMNLAVKGNIEVYMNKLKFYSEKGEIVLN